jgi:hypothetical protein
MSDSKKCSKCGIEKSLEEFSKDKSSKDGYISHCKECIKKYQEKNKDKIKEQRKKYKEENKDKIKESDKKYRVDNKEQIKKYQEENKEKLKEYRAENKEKLKEYNKKYRKENKEQTKEYNKKYQKEKYDNDPLFKLTITLRSRMIHAIKDGMGFTKCGKSEELLGCTFEEVRNHLESLFKDGMTWENHGKYGWHIDHRRPCASFDLSKPEEQRECFHYTNLQPLWATENLSKGDKWEEEVSMEDLFE